MASKPKYIADLEGRMETLEKNQDEILDQTKEIHTALMGTEYDQANPNGGKGGGMVKRLGAVEGCVSVLKRWQVKVNTTNTIIWIVAGGALTALWSLVLIKLR